MYCVGMGCPVIQLTNRACECYDTQHMDARGANGTVKAAVLKCRKEVRPMKQYKVTFDPDYGVEVVEEPDYYGPVTRYYETDIYHVMANSEEEAIEVAEFERSIDDMAW